MAVTIKDIAKKAGVSYSTVSRALNGAECVNKKKRAEICMLAKEMGYSPNPAAVHLKKAKSGIIGLYVEDLEHISSPFSMFSGIKSVYDVLGKEYSAVVKAINKHIPGSLNPALYDGVIAFDMSVPQYAFWDEVKEKGIPLVIANQQIKYDAPIVNLDQEDAIYRSMKFLLEKGHRKICVLEGEPDRGSTILRHAGWVSAVTEFGMDPAFFSVYDCKYSYYYTSLMMPELMKTKPDAILAFNDEMACAAVNYARHSGYRVPEDISVIGFDNWNSSVCEAIGLTTFDRQIDTVAKKCLSLLLKMIQGEEVPSEIHYVKAEFVDRGSVAECGGQYGRVTD